MAESIPLVKPRSFNEDWRVSGYLEGGFDAEECDRIVALRTEMKVGKARPGRNVGLMRDSRICWVRPNPESAWLFEKLRQAVVHVNQNVYRAELDGFTEPLQISEYGVGHFYDWHLDIGKSAASIRKISFVVQLSEETDYEGGELELLFATHPVAQPKTRGTIVLFPSYILHRVTRVTRGSRMSLVGWVGGPPYR
jgi:PKHD-type hydroxylase